jgi:putative ABC transport system substrate-binding protein
MRYSITWSARPSEGVEHALAGIGQERTAAVIVVTDPLFFAQRSKIVDAAKAQRIPSMFGFREFVDLGGLMSYGASLPALYRRAATYVDISKHAGRVKSARVLV